MTLQENHLFLCPMLFMSTGLSTTTTIWIITLQFVIEVLKPPGKVFCSSCNDHSSKRITFYQLYFHAFMHFHFLQCCSVWCKYADQTMVNLQIQQRKFVVFRRSHALPTLLRFQSARWVPLLYPAWVMKHHHTKIVRISLPVFWATSTSFQGFNKFKNNWVFCKVPVSVQRFPSVRSGIHINATRFLGHQQMASAITCKTCHISFINSSHHFLIAQTGCISLLPSVLHHQHLILSKWQ